MGESLSPHPPAAAATQARKYDEWSEATRLSAAHRFSGLAHNGWTHLVTVRLAEARRRGPACFDRPFYTSANRFDLGFIDGQPDPQARLSPRAPKSRREPRVAATAGRHNCHGRHQGRAYQLPWALRNQQMRCTDRVLLPFPLIRVILACLQIVHTDYLDDDFERSNFPACATTQGDGDVLLLQAAAWQHFLNSGIYDGRPHRFTC